MEILLNDQVQKCINGIPASLDEHLWPHKHYCLAYEDPRVDILLQHVPIGDFDCLRLNLCVREKVKIKIWQDSPMIFILNNIGPSLKCGIGAMPCQDFGSCCFNVFHLPEFSMELYPDADEKHYELLLIEIKDAKSLLNMMNAKETYPVHNIFGKAQH